MAQWSLEFDGPARTGYGADHGAYHLTAYQDHYSGEFGWSVTAGGWYVANCGTYVKPVSMDIAMRQAEHELSLRLAG